MNRQPAKNGSQNLTFLGVSFIPFLMNPEFERRVKETDWEQYVGPEHYYPDRVPTVLIALSKLDKTDKDDRLYNNVLFAIGNNHAGTYYPAILGALTFIEEIAACETRPFASRLANEILLDLLGPFCPDTDGYTKHSPTEIERYVHSRRPADFDKE